MSKELILTDKFDTEEDNSVVPFKLLPGGKDGNWLEGLPVGTCFLCGMKPTRQNPQPIFLDQYEVIQKEANNCVKLFSHIQNTEVWVKSHVFSMVMDLTTILGSVK